MSGFHDVHHIAKRSVLGLVELYDDVLVFFPAILGLADWRGLFNRMHCLMGAGFHPTSKGVGIVSVFMRLIMQIRGIAENPLLLSTNLRYKYYWTLEKGR